MTKEEFKALPYLLTPGQVASCGYAPATLNKYAENGILVVVLPKGCTQRRFQKLQVAQMLGWEDVIDRVRWLKEKPLLALAAVVEWSGYGRNQVGGIVSAGGLVALQPGGIGERKFRKEEVGKWLGF